MPPLLQTDPAKLDIEQPEQLRSYLCSRGLAAKNDLPTIRPLAGGVSNRTVLVRFSDGRALVLKQTLEKLRVAVDWHCDPRRIEREASGLRRLAELAPKGAITALVFEDRKQHLLAMEAAPEPHENWKAQLLAGEIGLDLVRQFGELLATIHRRSSQQRELLSTEFADRSFFESLRLEPYYAYTSEQVPVTASFLRDLIAETRGHSDALVHGDYSPKNIPVHDGRLVLLDHEVIHWGDPAFDLGFSLTHFLSKAHHLPVHRSHFVSAAKTYRNCYLETLGDVSWATTLEARAVRHTLACLLARVAGRSPLEYLSPVEQTRQIHVITKLINQPPERMDQLFDAFMTNIESHESH